MKRSWNFHANGQELWTVLETECIGTLEPERSNAVERIVENVHGKHLKNERLTKWKKNLQIVYGFSRYSVQHGKNVNNKA